MLGLYSALPAGAQQTQLWLTYARQGRIKGKWDYLVDLNHRRQDHFVTEPIQEAARVGLGYNLNAKHALAGGYAWFMTHTADERIDNLHENRLWQQWRFRWPIGRGAFIHRARLEERWRQSSASGMEDTYTQFTMRYRYFMSWQHPLFPKKPLQWIVATELMLQSGATISDPFQQWRLLGGFLWKSGAHTEWQFAYQFIQQNSAIWSKSNQAHTIRITASQLFGK